MSNRNFDLFEGQYILGETLGSGGMGTVHSAIEVASGRRVAIKLPHPALAGNPNVSRRFRAEGRAGAQLDHPNTVRVVDFGGEDGDLFLVMEYVAGVPLEQLVIDQGPLDTHGAVEVVRQLLAALDHAHAWGILHADVKTANLLVESTADAELHARLIDFGLARFSGESMHDGDRMLSGTPDYLAPELIEGGPPTIASDLYAAGVVLYELLTGFTPFGGGSSDEVMQRHVEGMVLPPSLRSPEQEIAPAIEAVVMRALERNPRDRFASAAQFAAALPITSAPTIDGAPRLARGSIVSAYSTEAITREWQPVALPAVPTRSLVTSERPLLAPLRDAVHQALVCGNDDLIVASYLELVRTLVDSHQLPKAVSELEHGLEGLRLDRAESPPAALWRLQLCLAALYSGLGNQVGARSAASIGRDDAVRAVSTVGRDRARELLMRLARQPPKR
ncbi:MAG TPA: serine/threonine-protein kinase [Kofleriaceae bacterium]